MKFILYAILVLMMSGFVACTTIEKDESIEQNMPQVIEPQPRPTETTKATIVPTLPPTATSIPDPTKTDIPSTITATPNSNITTISLVATIELDPYFHSSFPENVWWSEDSQVLYYQDIEAQHAWSYNLLSDETNVIPYVPRSFRELAPKIEETLPENAFLFSLSPTNQAILYKVPLLEAIPFHKDTTIANSAYYTHELWVRQDGQDAKLGLVDFCLGLTELPIWSANENMAVVNTAGTPGINCVHSSWLIDLDTLSVGPVDTPWEGLEYYSVRDISADGKILLIQADKNYFYNRATLEQWPVPEVDTANIVLLETNASFSCLFSDVEVSDEILREHLWSCKPITGKDSMLGQIDGNIVNWTLSPNNRVIALIVDNESFRRYEDIPKGIWVMILPEEIQ